MKIFRTSNPYALGLVHSILVQQDGGQNYVEHLVARMVYNSESMFFLIVSEGPDVKAFVIAELDNFQDFVWVWELWSDPHNPRKVVQTMRDKLVIWAKENGKTRMRGQTKRDETRAMARWGFEQVAIIVEAPLKEDEEK